MLQYRNPPNYLSLSRVPLPCPSSTYTVRKIIQIKLILNIFLSTLNCIYLSSKKIIKFCLWKQYLSQCVWGEWGLSWHVWESIPQYVNQLKGWPHTGHTQGYMLEIGPELTTKQFFIPVCLVRGWGRVVMVCLGKHTTRYESAEGLATHWARSELHVGNRHWTMSKREVFTITQPIFCKVLKCRLWLAQNRFYTYFAHSKNSEFSSKLPHTLSEGGSGKGWQGFPPTNGSTDRQRGQYRLRVEESSLPFYSTFKFNKRGLLNSYSK